MDDLNDELIQDTVDKVKKIIKIKKETELAENTERDSEELKASRGYSEEIEKMNLEIYNREKVLQGLKEGLPVIEIARRNSDIMSKSTVKRYRTELIRKGIISEKEIQEAAQNRAKKRRELKAKEKEAKKELPEVKAQYEKIKEIVLKELKEGYSIVQIYKHNKGIISSCAKTGEIRRELIVEGKITVEEIENARKERKMELTGKVRNEEKAKKKNEIEQQEKEIHEQNKEVVLSELKQGLVAYEIFEKYQGKIGNEKMIYKLKRELIAEGRITEEEIKEARKKKKTNDKREESAISENNKEIVLNELREGFSAYQMSKKYQETIGSKYIIEKIIKELIAEGRITEYEINEAREKKKN